MFVRQQKLISHLTDDRHMIYILTDQYGNYPGANMSRTRASAETRKKQIIEAAMRCFQRKGYENTTIDDIAAEYGLSKGSIYWYYSSKKDIIIDLFQRWTDELLKGITEQLQPVDSAREKLLQMGLFFIDNLRKDLELFRTMMVIWSMAYEDESIRQMNVEFYQQYDDVIISILKQGEKTGEFSTVDKKTYSAVSIALMDGLMVRQILVEDLNLNKIRKEIKNIIEGLLPPRKK